MHLWDLKVGTYPWLEKPEEREIPFGDLKNLAQAIRNEVTEKKNSGK